MIDVNMSCAGADSALADDSEEAEFVSVCMRPKSPLPAPALR
jgi:hypothetical protein